MGLLTQAAAWLADTLDEAAGTPVTYTRGAVEVPLTAVVGSALPAVTQPGTPAVRTPTTDRDYLFRRADLVAGGVFPPATGDRITESIDGTAATFVAAKRADGPVWEWGEPERVTVRVRTVPAK